MKRTPPSIDITVTLVAPNDEAYWNFAAVRGILPDTFPDDQLFLPLIPAFKKYARQLEHIIGKAESLDPDARTVTISTASGSQRNIPYDTLVIATGSSFKEAMPFKHLSTIQETKDELHKFQNKIRAAKSVVVAGAGMTGVEVVAELGQEYARIGAKEITLIADDDLPLTSEAKLAVRETIVHELEKNRVRIVKNTRVVDTSPEDAKGPRTLHLRSKDGKTSTMVADVVLKTYGIIPNSGFVPPKMLNEAKHIKTTPSMQAEGYESIFVLGDVSSAESPSGVRKLLFDIFISSLSLVSGALTKSGSRNTLHVLPNYPNMANTDPKMM